MWNYNYTSSYSDEGTSEELMHYGVLGMKWGVKKAYRNVANKINTHIENRKQNTKNDLALRSRKLNKAYKYSRSMSKTAAVLDYKHELRNKENKHAKKMTKIGVLAGVAINSFALSNPITALPVAVGIGSGMASSAISRIGNKPIRKAISEFGESNKINDRVKYIEKQNKDPFLIEYPNLRTKHTSSMMIGDYRKMKRKQNIDNVRDQTYLEDNMNKHKK